MGFKENLKIARERYGLTRAQMGEKLGMSGVAYGNYELGHREPKLKRLCQIAFILQTTPDALLGYSLVNNPTRYERLEQVIKSTGCTLKRARWRHAWEQGYHNGYEIIFPNEYSVTVEKLDDLENICHELVKSNALKRHIKEVKFLELKRILLDYGQRQRERNDRELEQYLDTINKQLNKDGKGIIGGFLPFNPPNKNQKSTSQDQDDDS